MGCNKPWPSRISFWHHDFVARTDQAGPTFTTLFIRFCIVAVPLMFIVPGMWLLWQRAVGTHVQAEVTACTTHLVGRSYAEYCTATWTRNGHVVLGDIEGSGSGDIGRKIRATVRGDTAYSTSLTLPFLLIGLGLPFVFLTVRYVRVRDTAPGQAAP